MRLIVIVVAATLMAACAGDDSSDDADSGTTTPSSSQTSSQTSSPTPSQRPTTPPTEETVPPKDGPVTLTGVPHAGVEANCWLLDDYLLIGGDQELIGSGERLEITGTPMEGAATTCMQGTPLEVESVIPAPSS